MAREDELGQIEGAQVVIGYVDRCDVQERMYLGLMAEETRDSCV
jgi:hypothetical protein